MPKVMAIFAHFLQAASLYENTSSYSDIESLMHVSKLFA